MKLFTAVSVLLLAPFTVALPQAGADPNFVPTGPYYHLKTRLHPGQPEWKAKYDNLYLKTSHTGAGLNDATFTPNKTEARRAFFNDTGSVNGAGYQMIKHGNYAFSMSLPGNSLSYFAWRPVEINGWGGDRVFIFNASSLVVQRGSSRLSFGWMVCDWWHNEPQLFYLLPYGEHDVPHTPSNCADIDLVKEDL